ncbi:hypothetical protein [Paenibacillus nasutitermitis]|uniref:Uncharacterized protein n=1 Tax=Paenibacillus nasutitermitis TaxID=1652958 RepID=A0A916ZJ24_9BACL|nr:hypothetical protein [Paenibacillus nasutitermitis]GGE00080.1 hypothetical protein GCM10010911_68810 [Paenibacillus nasutitermitis]
MNKKLIVATAVIALAIGGSAVYAQSNTNHRVSDPTTQVAQKDPSKILISKQDFNRMVQIIKDVNSGKIPVSALKDAQPLLDKSPSFYGYLTNFPEYFKLKDKEKF